MHSMVSVSINPFVPGTLLSMHVSTPVPEIPHVEMTTPMLWPPGMAAGQNKFTIKVFHRSHCVVLGGHDIGCMVPHIPCGPFTLLPLVMLFSSRPTNFASSTVVAEGTPLGCASAPWFMSYCNSPVALPFGFAMNWFNTMSVGVTTDDLAMGALNIATGVIADLVCSRIGNMKGPSVHPPSSGTTLRELLQSPAFLSQLAQQVVFGAGGAGSRVGNAVGQWAARTAINVVSGLARTAATGQGTLPISIGQPHFGVQYSVQLARHQGPENGSRTVAGYDVSIARQTTVFNRSQTVTSNADYSVTTQETTSGPLGAHTVTHHVDAQGRPMSDDNKVSDGHPWGSAL